MRVDSVIDDAPVGRFHVTLFLVSLLIMILEGIEIQVIGFVAPSIIADWGIPSQQLGPIFSAGLAGAMIGAAVFGSVGDQRGRRPVILGCMTLFSAGTLLTPFTSSVESLTLLRFVTSLGLGGVIPNVISLCSELSPRRIRAFFVGSVATSQLVGGVVGSLLASWLLQNNPWQLVFYVIGIASLLFIIPVATLLPESLRFLVIKRKSTGRIRSLLLRLNADEHLAGKLYAQEPVKAQSNVLALFQKGYAATTLLLWLAIAANLFMTAFIIYWLPTLLVQSGIELSTAIMSITIMNFAGILGGLCLSVMLNRLNPFLVLAAVYFVAALAVSQIGFLAPWVPGVFMAVFAAGFLALGGFAGISSIAATLYPTELRSTGVGSAIAASKAGAIFGPMAAGAALAAGMSLPVVFMICGLGGITAGIALLLLFRVRMRVMLTET
jgi:AAHS family 4-hydroxybenzoate transporter-like MFS transporter